MHASGCIEPHGKGSGERERERENERGKERKHKSKPRKLNFTPTAPGLVPRALTHSYR